MQKHFSLLLILLYGYLCQEKVDLFYTVYTLSGRLIGVDSNRPITIDRLPIIPNNPSIHPCPPFQFVHLVGVPTDHLDRVHGLPHAAGARQRRSFPPRGQWIGQVQQEQSSVAPLVRVLVYLLLNSSPNRIRIRVRIQRRGVVTRYAAIKTFSSILLRVAACESRPQNA